MKGLTVLQPWADAIAYLDKRVENRTWRAQYRGPIVLHAGKSTASYTARAVNDISSASGGRTTSMPQMRLGCALAIVRIRASMSVEQFRAEGLHHVPSIGNWLDGPYAFWLDEPLVLEMPVSMRGAQGLFTVDKKSVVAVARAARPAEPSSGVCRWCGCSEKEACCIEGVLCSSCIEFEEAR